MICSTIDGPCTDTPHHRCLAHDRCGHCGEAGFFWIVSIRGVWFKNGGFAEMCRNCGGQSAAWREEVDRMDSSSHDTKDTSAGAQSMRSAV